MAKTAQQSSDRWAAEPMDEDYQAAARYLSLTMPTEIADNAVRALRVATPVRRQAKDLLRASRLPLLPRNDARVAQDLKKLKRAQPLTPVLLVRGDVSRFERPLIVADGYHRICAIVYVDEESEVACCIADVQLGDNPQTR